MIVGNTGNVVCNTSEDLRLGFASDDFAGTKWKNLTGPPGGATARRWLPSTTLTSPACCGVRKDFQARLDEVEAWQAQRGPKNK